MTLKSSKILTVDGYKNIEDLDVNKDLVYTVLCKSPIKINKIIKYTLDFQNIEKTNRPFVIKKDFFAQDSPNEDICIFGHYKIILQNDIGFYKGVHTYKIPKLEMLDITNKTIDYYTIELVDNYGFFISGLPVESYI